MPPPPLPTEELTVEENFPNGACVLVEYESFTFNYSSNIFVCSSYECFILRAMRLSNKLLGQGYVKERLKSSLGKFYGRYGDLTKQYEVPLSRMLHDILDDDHIQ